MSNIKCKGNKEIDLLVVNPKTGEKYHVESRVSTTFKLKIKATCTGTGKCHKNGIDYFLKEKFNHPQVQEKIHEIFGNSNYKKILVVWDVENEDVINQAKLCGLEIKKIEDILEWFMKSDVPKGSRDDIVRMFELTRKVYEKYLKKKI